MAGRMTVRGLRLGFLAGGEPDREKTFLPLLSRHQGAHLRQLVMQLRLPVVPELGHQQVTPARKRRLCFAAALHRLRGENRLPGNLHFVQPLRANRRRRW